MEVGKSMRTQRRGFGAHTQVLHNVEENEQRGGPSTVQSSAYRIGPAGWSSTTNHNEGKGLGKTDLRACYDVTMGRRTPTTGVTSHTGNGSVKSVRSEASWTLDELRVMREARKLEIKMADAIEKASRSRLSLLSIDSQISRPREGSRRTSAASSKTSSHHSRQDRRRRNKPKRDEHNRSLRRLLDEVLTSVREDSFTVDYDSVIQRKLRQGSVSGSNGESARSGALEFYSNESGAQRTSTIPHTRLLQDVVDDGGTITLPARDLPITDDRITTTRAYYPGTSRSAVQHNATAPAQVVGPYRPNQVVPVDRHIIPPRDQYDTETRRMTDEMSMRTAIAKQEQQMLLAAHLEKLQKAENTAAIKMAEERATAAKTVSAIKHREEIQAAASKSAREMHLQHIRSQRASTTAGPPAGANKPPTVGTTLIYDAGQFIHPGNSQNPS
jgi:hypothetical protein